MQPEKTSHPDSLERKGQISPLNVASPSRSTNICGSRTRRQRSTNRVLKYVIVTKWTNKLPSLLSWQIFVTTWKSSLNLKFSCSSDLHAGTCDMVVVGRAGSSPPSSPLPACAYSPWPVLLLSPPALSQLVHIFQSTSPSSKHTTWPTPATQLTLGRVDLGKRTAGSRNRL